MQLREQEEFENQMLTSQTQDASSAEDQDDARLISETDRESEVLQ
jgi:hypothetical protein